MEFFGNYTYHDVERRLIPHLPKFRGHNGDNPLTHLRDLHHVCRAFMPRGSNEGDFMLKMFPYSLSNYALCWFDSLTIYSFFEWDWMQMQFLKEYSLKQYSCEPLFEYLERFTGMLENSPNHGLPEHVIGMAFLDGLLPKERYILDDVAGGSVLDCCVQEVWDIIEARAAQTRSYIAYNSEQPFEDMTGREVKDTPTELSSEPAQLSLDDTEVMAATSNGEEDVMDEVLQVVPTTCNEDIKAEPEDLIPSQCSNMIVEQGTIRSINLDSLLISDNFVSSDVQDHDSTEMLSDDQLGIPLCNYDSKPPLLIDKDKLLDVLCINWKIRKKGKHMNLKEGVSSFFLPEKQVHSTFGWKPGWNSCGSAYRVTKKHVGGCWRKFDGVHPWKPNIMSY